MTNFDADKVNYLELVFKKSDELVWEQDPDAI